MKENAVLGNEMTLSKTHSKTTKEPIAENNDM